jgi:histidinol-phosphatase
VTDYSGADFSMTDFSVTDDLAVALTLAGEADLIAMDRYQAQDLDIQLKPDRTQVTDGDQRVERMIRSRLAAARPRDSVFGEEFGTTGQSTRQLALVVDGVPQLGVVSAPALGRRWWGATGHGAWMQQDDGEPRRLSVSRVDKLADASLSYNSIKHWDQAGRLDNLITLTRAVGRARAYGDLWPYMLLAEGAVDVVGEYDLKPWDIAALVPVVREAGGTFTSMEGGDPMSTDGVLATNGLVHRAVIDALG